MSVAILNGHTGMGFIEDGEAFDRCIEERFMILDVNGDGVLSRSELQKEFEGLLTIDMDSGYTEEEVAKLYDIVFEKFDSDHDGSIDAEEFRSEMREIMVAVAHGIGDSPVQVALESDSLLMKAVEHELAKNHNKGPKENHECPF